MENETTEQLVSRVIGEISFGLTGEKFKGFSPISLCFQEGNFIWTRTLNYKDKDKRPISELSKLFKYEGDRDENDISEFEKLHNSPIIYEEGTYFDCWYLEEYIESNGF